MRLSLAAHVEGLVIAEAWQGSDDRLHVGLQESGDALLDEGRHLYQQLLLWDARRSATSNRIICKVRCGSEGRTKYIQCSDDTSSFLLTCLLINALLHKVTLMFSIRISYEQSSLTIVCRYCIHSYTLHSK